MKFLLGLVLLISVNCISQNTDYNTKKGYIAGGFDVVAYFNGQAIKGVDRFETEYDGVKFMFSSENNLSKFLKNPEKYLPQYGGYCAYALGLKGEKVDINPKTFEIRDGKLYLFYNSWGNNTLDSWLSEGAEKLRSQADLNWQKIKNKD